jgi:hypothetical protein
MTRDKEIQLEPTVDRILDLHLRFGKWDLDEEPPKSVCAKDTRGSRVPRVNQIGVVHSRDEWNPPAAAAIHVNVPTEDPLFEHTGALGVSVVCFTPDMRSHGVSWVRTQVDALCALDIILPIIWSSTFGVPAVLESRIRLIRRSSVRGYG